MFSKKCNLMINNTYEGIDKKDNFADEMLIHLK